MQEPHNERRREPGEEPQRPGRASTTAPEGLEALAGQLGNQAFAQLARSLRPQGAGRGHAPQAEAITAAAGRLARQGNEGPSAPEAEPLGIRARTRPVSANFSIENSVPPESFETERFTVEDGRVSISTSADWNPSSPDAPDDYTVELFKWGLLSDDRVPGVFAAWTRRRSPHPQNNTWRDLASGSYYLRIRPSLNVVSASARFEGSITAN